MVKQIRKVRNKKVLSRNLKQAALFAISTSAGSLIHIVGAAILEARAPHRVRDLGTCRIVSLSDDSGLFVASWNGAELASSQISKCLPSTWGKACTTELFNNSATGQQFLKQFTMSQTISRLKYERRKRKEASSKPEHIALACRQIY